MKKSAAATTRPASPAKPDAPAGRGPTGDQPVSTRDRILDVALELFTDQGFDGTSLREIAERLGFTKAALYYHFESKEDILMALHLRMHEVGLAGMTRLVEGPVDLASWAQVLDSLMSEMMAQRPLFRMHQRNAAALERMHNEDHEAEHQDLQDRLRQILKDPTVALRDRVRMAASFGALFSVMFLGEDAFVGEDSEELEQQMRSAIADLLVPRR